MSTDIKVSKTQVFKTIQSGGSLGGFLANLGKKNTNKCCYSFSQSCLPGLVTNLTYTINKFERKISKKGAVRTEKAFTSFFSNEDMNDNIQIIKSSEDSGVLIDGVTETVKHEINKQEGRFLEPLLAPLVALLVQPVVSSVAKEISRRGVTKSTKRIYRLKFQFYSIL